MQRLFGPERLIRLYPRAWRERYGVEMRALLEQLPASWTVRGDLVRGLVTEWTRLLTAGAIERFRGPRARQVFQAYGFLGFCYVATIAARFFGDTLNESGYHLTGPTRSDSAVFAIISVRAIAAWASVLSGTRRWLLVRHTELMGWAMLTVAALTVGRMEALQFGTSWHPFLQALGSFFLLGAGTPKAFAAQRCVEARLMNRAAERTDILGLRG